VLEQPGFATKAACEQFRKDYVRREHVTTKTACVPETD
jgi:hypothetical protein